MRQVRLPTMSMSEAENALVELWLLLEKHNLASPAMTVKIRPRDRISLFLAVKGPEAVDELYQDWARRWRQRNPQAGSDRHPGRYADLRCGSSQREMNFGGRPGLLR